MKPLPTADDFIAAARERGYTVFQSIQGKPFNLNIVGWRDIQGHSNEFNDYIAVYYYDPVTRTWESEGWKATTRPGTPWLLKPMNPKGAAIMVPGQYRSAYQLGNFRGYTALKQVRPVKVFRDGDQDHLWDSDQTTIETGLFGLHIHRAGFYSRSIGLWSAGCQVIEKKQDFDSFISLCQLGQRYWGTAFTYTLLEF